MRIYRSKRISICPDLGIQKSQIQFKSSFPESKSYVFQTVGKNKQ